MLLWLTDLKILIKEKNVLIRILLLILILILLYTNALLFVYGDFTPDYIFKEGFENISENYSADKSIEIVNFRNL